MFPYNSALLCIECYRYLNFSDNRIVQNTVIYSRKMGRGMRLKFACTDGLAVCRHKCWGGRRAMGGILAGRLGPQLASEFVHKHGGCLMDLMDRAWLDLISCWLCLSKRARPLLHRSRDLPIWTRPNCPEFPWRYIRHWP